MAHRLAPRLAPAVRTLLGSPAMRPFARVARTNAGQHLRGLRAFATNTARGKSSRQAVAAAAGVFSTLALWHGVGDREALFGNESVALSEGSKAKKAANPAADGSYLDSALSVVVVGASSGLAQERTYPALFNLYKRGMLPPNTRIYGYGQDWKTDQALRDQLRPHLTWFAKKSAERDSASKTADAGRDVEGFLALCVSRSGPYNSGMKKLAAEMARDEGSSGVGSANRLFYFAVPSSSYAAAARAIKRSAVAPNGWTRLAVDKPFGMPTANQQSAELNALFDEGDLYRIDHYLGKEMVQNMLVMRFANSCFEPLWNRNNVAAVYMTFKEPFGVGEGHGSAFDSCGIIRDVIQSHMLQVLSLVAMEAPSNIHDGTTVTDEKVKLLRCIEPIKPENVVLGQYVASADGSKPAYVDGQGVPNNSKSPTFASVVLYIDNPRWQGVPFIIKAGKALDQHKTDVRLQLKNAPGAAHIFQGQDCPRNEIVIRLQPNESIFIRANVKQPGLSMAPVQSELDLTYKDRYGKGFLNDDAHTRMVLNVLLGNQSTFVRQDELQFAGDIFTPVLDKVDQGELPVCTYEFGSRGPSESDALAIKVGYDAKTIMNRLAAGPRDDRPIGGGYTKREMGVYTKPIARRKSDKLVDFLPDYS